jgi:hypothetical protein
LPTLPGYTRFGGVHSETAALANSLNALGLRAPHTGQHYTEALLLGLGGGLGAGYILYEFQEHHARVLVLGFRYQWQYTVKYLDGLCQRLGLEPAAHETGSRAAAAKQLQAVLDAGRAPIAWVDKAHMPYLQLPDSLKGHLGHWVAVAGREAGGWLVDDLAAQPFLVSDADLAAARARITSYKHRLLVPTPLGAAPDLPIAVLAGLRDCAANLLGKSDSFSLPALHKWAKMLTDKKNKKAWPVLFAAPRGLYGLLKSAFEGINLGTDGPDGLRGLYADFLLEAAPLVDRPGLAQVAGLYRALAAQWVDLAEAFLPSSVPVFETTKDLVRRKHQRLRAAGQAAVAEVQALTDQLQALHAEVSREFPLDAAQIQSLFADLSVRLRALYAAEVAAARALQESLL